MKGLAEITMGHKLNSDEGTNMKEIQGFESDTKKKKKEEEKVTEETRKRKKRL